MENEIVFELDDLKKLRNKKFKSFDEYQKERYSSFWVLKLNKKDWMNSLCDCPSFNSNCPSIKNMSFKLTVYISTHLDTSKSGQSCPHLDNLKRVKINAVSEFSFIVLMTFLSKPFCTGFET